MLTLAIVAAILAAVFHVLAFVLESVLFPRPQVWRRFGLTSQRDADAARLMALSQGFYNLFLAAGAIAGIVAITLDHRTVGGTLLAFSAACMLGAGVVLAFTGGRRLLRSAIFQATPPLITLVALIVDHSA